jgi:UDP-glucose 4-epimerase
MTTFHSRHEHTSFKSILILGIKGDLAQTTAKLLHKQYPQATIVGIDEREIPQDPGLMEISAITILKIQYERSQFDLLFKQYRFDLVFHIGRIDHPDDYLEHLHHHSKYLDLGPMEEKRFFDLCLEYKIKKLVFLSSHHVYGARFDNPIFLTEEDPLRCQTSYPSLMKALESDHLCTQWMWRHQDQIETVLLRPSNIVGPHLQNTMVQYLTTWYSPQSIDFNPGLQFIHEFDMAKILIHSVSHIPTGIYNVSHPEVITVRESLKLTQAKGIPMPIFFMTWPIFPSFKLFPYIPPYFYDFLKYPCLLNSEKIFHYLPKNFFKYSSRDALKLLSGL